MLKKAVEFAKKPTSLHIIINTVGNYANTFFTAAFAIILVRIMSPAQYGVLSVLLSISYILSNVLDLGVSAAIYSYLPSMLKKNEKDSYQFIKSTFIYQSLLSLVVILVLYLIFPLLDKVFFKTNAPYLWLFTTATSIIFFVWSNYISNILLVAKKFFKVNFYSLISSVSKAIIIIVLAYLKLINAGSVIFVFGIIGPLIYFILVLSGKKERLLLLMKSPFSRKELRIKFTLTYFIASQFFSMGQRMDLFLLSFYYPGSADVGYFGLAQKIVLTVMSTVTSITQVLSPGFSNIKTKKEVTHHLKTGFVYMLLPAGILVLLFLTPNIIFQLVFTKKFLPTAAIARAMSLPTILYAYNIVLFLFLLYTVKKPIYALINNIIYFFVYTISCYLLIPTYKAFGPSYAILIAFSINCIFYTIVSIKEYKKL